MFSTTLISQDNTWALWTVLSCTAALAIYLEQKYKWANKVTACIISIFTTLILSNLNIIPTKAAVYDSVWNYVVPLAVPMLLFKANIKKIAKDSGRLFFIYIISSIGTLLGSFIAFYILRGQIKDLAKIMPMFTGTYTGGSVNFVAMADNYKVDQSITSAALVADNLLMALYFFVLIALPSINFIYKRFTHPYIDGLEREKSDETKTKAAQFWKAKEISLLDIAKVIATAFFIVTLSDAIARYFSYLVPKSTVFMQLVNALLSNKYLIMTTMTMLASSVFSSYFERMSGSQEIGSFLIYLFFAVIGAPASLKLIIEKSPLLLLLAAIIVLVNLIISLIFGKLFKFSIEEIIIASNANVGGPTTAAAMAVSKSWDCLIAPALLVGTLGYVLGNWYGIIVGTILK
ncbi:DUF819 family protein [Fenollaria sporofastidiosus]|uniref:DUF819 family protein n=1 Tax=Fenollaria sporofastidiosus TaxID=2811778 RepID=UPI001C005476|nr:DUF819 family protein [Fenollaria sporofastidiosus]